MNKRGTIFFIILLGLSISFIQAIPSAEFQSPTFSNNYVNASVLWETTPTYEINATINTPNLGELKFNWNGANYTFYDEGLVLRLNFDNYTLLNDTSRQQNQITKYGDPEYNSSGKYGGAYNFDGNDYLNCGTNPNMSFGRVNDTFTLSSWINTEGTGGTIIGTHVGGNRPFYLVLSSGRPILKAYNGTTIMNVPAPDAINDGNWHNVVGVKNSTHFVLYVDGEEVANGTYTITNNLNGSGYIGVGYYGVDTYFVGKIDEIQIFNRSFNSNEIRETYFSNLRKMNATSWNFYSNKSSDPSKFLGETTFQIISSNLSGFSFESEKRTAIIYGANTTQYYDNRKSAVVATFDDWHSLFHVNFSNASIVAERYKIIFTMGVTPGASEGFNSTHWSDIQSKLDSGFTQVISHSYTHVYPCINASTCDMTNASKWRYLESYNVTKEIEVTKHSLEDNLTLLIQNTFNNTEHMVGFIRPGGYIDVANGTQNSLMLAKLEQTDHLVERPVDVGGQVYKEFNESVGFYYDAGYTNTASDYNVSKFDERYDAGQIYHVFGHPWDFNFTDGSNFINWASYVGNRTDVWYSAFDHLYMYRYLAYKDKPTKEILNFTRDNLEIKFTANNSARNRWALSYPLTYSLSVPSWNNTFVFYKNESSQDYVPLPKKTEQDFFNGIDAYRKNLTGNEIYISKAFPQTTSTLYLKISSAPLSSFSGTDLTRVNLSAIENLSIEKTTFGKIDFTQTIDLSNATNLDSFVNISQNFISIDSENLPSLNTSAQLSFYNLSFTTPRILKNNAECTDCVQVSYSGGTLIFNVTSFSNYTTEESATTNESSSSSSSGSGGGTTIKTYSLNEEDLTSAKEYWLKVKEKIKIKIIYEDSIREQEIELKQIVTEGENRSISIILLGELFSLREGEKTEKEVPDKNNTQIFLEVKNITSTQAKISIYEINKERPIQSEKGEELKNLNNSEDSLEGRTKKGILISIIIFSLILVIILLGYLIMKKDYTNSFDYKSSF